ncbi:TraB/GumN family protein [Croceibacterium ferulae]|uniref:TraB/GumN family protein n=1 Tax=Croceibacterium ferulae TaxID=1854641 RepID=UPI000EB46152|nr:TraB/GumN family protein [Croceibacterium ferulae]
MRRLVAALLLSLLAACGRSDWPKPAPALWQVTGQAGQEGWLFGTIHALPDGADWRTPVLDDALEQAGRLVVEVDNLADTRAMQAAFARRAYTPGLPPLPARVPPADRPALLAALDDAGLDGGELTPLEDWAAALTLANALRRGDVTYGVDRALIAGSHRVIGLESVDEQLALFDTLPAAAQAALLRDAVREAGTPDDGARIRAWLTGDTAALEQDAATGLLADPVLRQRLQTSRNHAWLPAITGLLDDGTRPFVAVGAAHMLGPDGLPALLRARGYTVTRIQ